ncbi:MAG: hypothetical protein ABI947_27345 [Chloroflexota bacterium]
MPLPHTGLGSQATPDLTIDQSRPSTNPARVVVVSIGLGQALITA